MAGTLSNFYTQLLMPASPSPILPQLRVLVRLVAVALSQWLAVLILGSCLFACFYPEIDCGLFTTSLRDKGILSGLYLLTITALFSSVPAFLLLLLVLGYLRTKGTYLPVAVRWSGLLAAITACVLLSLSNVGFDLPGNATLRLLWPLDGSWPWVLAAYAAIPWANRKYLRSSLPPTLAHPHAPAPPAVRI
ncbi:hypothetical protein E5K00_18220 [Hymenobacter aquaticus]|uniref:Uncharacterized protein n=1 Tax=Hymenobacter aquaticus TaxID=1867101 RepID=A0A4Z0PY03_9BACT|nr:hypothetical protein [Hymenobacter aquaticus]TGE22184.1 hypothetical protein E5K00_18220 [Hymenobacter aquaticus]